MSYGGQQHYGAPPGGPPGHGGAPPPQQGYGGAQGHGGYTPPPAHSAPPAHGGYGAPPPAHGTPAHGAPPTVDTACPRPRAAPAAMAAGSRPRLRRARRLVRIRSALWSWFSSVDTDRSGAITTPELERALINGDWTPFDLDTVKLLMTIFDTDRSGTIGFNEAPVIARAISILAGLAGGDIMAPQQPELAACSRAVAGVAIHPSVRGARLMRACAFAYVLGDAASPYFLLGGVRPGVDNAGGSGPAHRRRATVARSRSWRRTATRWPLPAQARLGMCSVTQLRGLLLDGAPVNSPGGSLGRCSLTPASSYPRLHAHPWRSERGMQFHSHAAQLWRSA
ncbi:hypothetical protein C8J57DRAFT_1643051 [Mycena rebaudengoi]|nr:hypothetical protein C8J57DRAFT_1643051 [Mycena rebaudengoi]